MTKPFWRRNDRKSKHGFPLLVAVALSCSVAVSVAVAHAVGDALFAFVAMNGVKALSANGIKVLLLEVLPLVY